MYLNYLRRGGTRAAPLISAETFFASSAKGEGKGAFFRGRKAGANTFSRGVEKATLPFLIAKREGAASGRVSATMQNLALENCGHTLANLSTEGKAGRQGTVTGAFALPGASSATVAVTGRASIILIPYIYSKARDCASISGEVIALL